MDLCFLGSLCLFNAQRCASLTLYSTFSFCLHLMKGSPSVFVHVAESNSWQWFCQLSWTVGLQPLPGAALTGFEYFTWSKSATLDLICSIGFISASCDSSTPFASFLLHKIAQILSKSETFDMVWERVLRKKMNLWFDNDWCISCLIPLFVVLCSEKMERSLEMTEKAV